MQNVVNKYENAIDLIEEDPYNNGAQAKIVLQIDWRNQIVDVITVYNTGGMPIEVYNGVITQIGLSRDIDARYVFSGVESIMPEIDEISKGYQDICNGNNYKGFLSQNSMEKLHNLEYKIESHQIFQELHSPMGIWDAIDWFGFNFDCVSKRTSDSKLQEISKELTESARINDGIVIAGGEYEVYKLLKEYQQSMIDGYF